jgi:hypothetical protein
LIDGGSLSEEQARGVRGALNDTPIAFAALSSVPLPAEEKANLVFILVKLIDDMLSLGATAMVAGNEDIARSVINGGRLGGQLSAEIRRGNQRAWQVQTLKLATDIVQKNGRLTLDDLAAKISERWEPTWPRLPGDKMIIAFLSQCRRNRTLPERTR